jgi:transcriptional regulator with XRE-family HTH domain
MSDRRLVVSEIVSQLVADARRQEGLSLDELADRAGVPPTYVDLLERRSRQPTTAAAASLAEALGLSLSELVAEAEHDVDGDGDGDGEAEVDLVPAPPRRRIERANVGDCVRLEQTTGLTREAIAEAVEFTYRKLDVIDQQTRDSGARPFVAFVDVPELSSLVSTALGASLARASQGLYAQNGPDHSPTLLPLRQGLSELEVEVALETNQPMSAPRETGVYLFFRYVLTERDGTFRRGKETRGDSVAVWEVRFGELEEHDFGARAGGNGRARLRREALNSMELVYYDPALLPYAKPTGVYARSANS